MVQPVGSQSSSSGALPTPAPTVTVQAGQSLADIAAQNGTTPAALLRANPQLSASSAGGPPALTAGQRLALPTTTARVDISDPTVGPGADRAPRGGALPGGQGAPGSGGQPPGTTNNPAPPPQAGPPPLPNSPTPATPASPNGVTSTHPPGVTSGPVPPGAAAPQARPSVGVTSGPVPPRPTAGPPNAAPPAPPAAPGAGAPQARPSVGVTSGPVPARPGATPPAPANPGPSNPGMPNPGGPSTGGTSPSGTGTFGAPQARPSVGVTSPPVAAGNGPTAQPSVGVTSGPIPAGGSLPGGPGAVKPQTPANPALPGPLPPPTLPTADTGLGQGLRWEGNPRSTIPLPTSGGSATPLTTTAQATATPTAVRSGSTALERPTAPPFQGKSGATGATAGEITTPPRGDLQRPSAPPAEGDAGLRRALDEGPVRQARQLAESDPRGLERLLQRTHGRFVDATALQRLIALARAGRWPVPARLAFVSPNLLQGAPVAYAASQGGTVLLSAALRNTPAGLTAALGEAAARHLDRALGVPREPLQPGRALLSGLATTAPPPRASEVARSVVAWSGQVFDVEVASPAIAAWLTRAASSSRVDGFINYAIAALVGAPTGIWAQRDAPAPMLDALEAEGAGSGLGRFRQAMDDVIEVVDSLARQGVPGAARLLASLEGARDSLLAALGRGDLRRARALFGSALGHLREGQVAAHLQARGATITSFGQAVEVPGGHQAAEIDVAARLGEEELYATVLAGQRGARKVADVGWRKLVELTDEVLRHAARSGARLTFFVDVLSPDLESFLTSRGIETKSNAGWVH